MSTSRFMREYWQKKPLLVRGALPAFADPLAPDELAGLACEDGIESRIVQEVGREGPWETTWGPHDEQTFAKLPPTGWTLLVQEVNRHVPKLAVLLDAFGFLPNVRVDDVMVSFAVPGGSVGAHLDSYDVFLIQGQGHRRWRYGTTPAVDTCFVPGLTLRILERFTPDVDEVFGPGDMLYLPPGFAHHGVAESPCLTYSVGFRAPNFGEMWKAFGAHLGKSASASELLADPLRHPVTDPGAIPPALLAHVRQVILAMDTSPDAIDRWFASFATQLAPGHELTVPRVPLSAEEVLLRLRRGDRVARSEEGRWAYLPGAQGGLLLYVAGQEFVIRAKEASLAKTLSGARRFDGRALDALLTTAAARELIVRLFAAGALRFVRRRAGASR
jgi:50S ribosomal protein L16 3-hydroxylase